MNPSPDPAWPKYRFLEGGESALDKQRNAAFRALADKIEANPELLDTARETNRQWLEKDHPNHQWANEQWETILLTWSTHEIAEFLRDPRSDPQDIRLSGPFAGLLSPNEIPHA